MGTTFEELTKIIFEEITPKLENNCGVAIFAKERAKFELAWDIWQTFRDIKR